MQRNNLRRSGSSWLKRQLRLRPRPLWLVVTAHVLVLGIALVVYSVPHHVIPRQQAAVGLTSSRDGMVSSPTAAAPAPSFEPAEPAEPTLAPEATADLSAEPTAAPDPAASQAPDAVDAFASAAEPAATDGVGQFRVKFADKFTSGDVEITEDTYRSANICVSFSTVRYDGSDVHVADIYVADIANFITVFGTDRYGRGSAYAEKPLAMAQRWTGIATLSGDYYGGRSDGVVIRNGMLYRDEKVSRDVCVLYWDGSMKTFSPGDFDAETELANGAYQAWNFGPMLLDENGQSMTSFNTDVAARNPRSIIGCYEPGHYCFIMVDGRSDASKGLTMTSCSEMVYKAGLTVAYNLDGGQTAAMCKGGEIYGVPYKGGRSVSDVLMIVDSAN